jgi:hypothetical protein
VISPSYLSPAPATPVAYRPDQEASFGAPPTSSDETTLREAFDSFVGETFYGTLLQSMRKTLDKPAYFHGGRAEEIFQGQLDQTLTEEMTKANAQHFTGPMFELFQLSRA